MKRIVNHIIKSRLDLLLSDGSFKTTESVRYPLSLQLFLESVKSCSELRICEVGPSYGQTSLYISKFFTQYFHTVNLWAYEKNLEFILSSFGSIFSLSDGKFVILVGFSIYSRFFVYPLNRTRKNPFHRYLSVFLGLLVPCALSFLSSIGVLISSPCVLFLDHSSPNISVSSRLEGMPIDFNCLIAMNVYNASYYSLSEVTIFLSQICTHLKDGAYLLIGRNDCSVENSSVFQYDSVNHSLKFVSSIGSGWDYQSPVINLNL